MKRELDEMRREMAALDENEAEAKEQDRVAKGTAIDFKTRRILLARVITIIVIVNLMRLL